MSNIMATIEKVVKTYDIENADNINMTQVLDYHVVTKKGEFKAGDYVIYARVDSIFPDGLSEENKTELARLKKLKKEQSDNTQIDEQISNVLSRNTIPEFEFLRRDKFTIKAKKYSKFANSLGNKIISEGIIFPTNIAVSVSKKFLNVKEGLDVTEILGITKVVEDDEEVLTEGTQDSKLNNFLMKYKFYRKLRRFFKNDKITGNWADFLPAKSDEENIQKIFTKIVSQHGRDGYIVSEKLEGQNISFYRYETKKFGGLLKKINYGVCSRNRHLPVDDGSQFWKSCKNLKFQEKLNLVGKNVLVRGEHCGPNIQGNIYKLKEYKIYIFDVWDIDLKKFYNYEETKEFCSKFGFEMVPVLNSEFVLSETVTELLEFSNGNSVLYPTLREGLVIRNKDNYNISFKVKSPEYMVRK